MRRARDRTPTRCRDGALHIPGESGWRFAAVRRATRGFLLSTLTLFTVLWAGALSVCLSQFGDDRPLACTRQTGKRRTGAAAEKRGCGEQKRDSWATVKPEATRG